MPARRFSVALAMLPGLAVVRAMGVALEWAPEDTACALSPPPTWTLAGELLPRNATSISKSQWSIGAETIDRGYSNPAAWLQYLPLVGAKSARIQGGWARCDPYGNGTFVWDWLDFTVDGISAAGTTPWMQLSYGNAAYPGGGSSSSGSPLPVPGPAREAFMSWASAAVARYAPLGVSTYEVWNEPNIQNITAPDMANFTAELLRAVAAAYPRDALAPLVTRVGTVAGVALNYSRALLSGLEALGALPLTSEFTYHPYFYNPDCCGAQEAEQRALVESYSGAGGAPIRLVQGEVGAPGEWQPTGALSPYNWTLCTQSKWFSRRILGDAQRQIESNMFSMVDICYPGGGAYHSGLLKTNCSDPSRPVIVARPAYGVVSRLFGLLDATWAPASASGAGNATAQCTGLPPGQSVTVLLFVRGAGTAPPPQQLLVTLWQDGGTPENPVNATVAVCDVTVEAPDAPAPALWHVADTLTGKVWAPPSQSVFRVATGSPRRKGLTSSGASASQVIIRGVPVSDFVLLLAPRGVFEVQLSS
jgi:hypothetical protein